MTAAKTTAANNEDRDQLMSDIQRIVESTISKMLPRTDQLRYTQLEKMTTDNARLLTGNGDPEKGLVYQVKDIKDDIERLDEKISEIKKEITILKNIGYVIGSTIVLWVLNQWLGLIPLHP